MADDCVMLECSRVSGGGEEEERENGGIELSLELSIGGSYAKSEKLMASGVKGGVDLEENGRSSGGSGKFGVLVYPQAKREIQALRRREARKKREGKLKRVNWKETNGCGSVSGNGSGGINSDQVARDNGYGLIERENKRGKFGDVIVGDNQGSIPVVPVQFTNGLVNNFYGGTTCLGAVGGNEVKSEKCCFQPTGCRSFRPYQGNRNCGKGGPASANVSPPVRSPSAFSDHQNTNMLGGNASDNGSNSSYSQPKIQQQKNIPSPTDPPEQSEPSNSSKQTESNHAIHSSADSPSNPSVKPSEKTKSDTEYSQLVNNNVPTPNISRPPPRPQTENNPDPTLRPHMPCVSTTGNGPNGKTVMGFLYRYNKDEVSIVCVCHGSSFSPAEFVEHAGGVDITHPLRHITVIPSSAFGV